MDLLHFRVSFCVCVSSEGPGQHRGPCPPRPALQRAGLVEVIVPRGRLGELLSLRLAREEHVPQGARELDARG